MKAIAFATALAACVLLGAGLGAAGPVCTVTGTDGDDVLTSGDRNDVICGLAGDDTIHARGGTDHVYRSEERRVGKECRL